MFGSAKSVAVFCPPLPLALMASFGLRFSPVLLSPPSPPEPPVPPDPPDPPPEQICISLLPGSLSKFAGHSLLPLTGGCCFAFRLPFTAVCRLFVPSGGSRFAFRLPFTAVCSLCSGLDPVSASTSSWFQICSEICFSLVGVSAKSVGSVVSLSIWHVLSISLFARRRHGNFSLVAVAKRSSFPLMVVTRRLPLPESGSDVSAAMSPAPFASLSNRAFCFAPTISWMWSSTKTPLGGFNPITSLYFILRYDFVSGFAVPLRFFTAACSPCKFYNMAFVAVVLASLSWWQLERKSITEFGIILDWELILSDHLNGDSDLPCIEVFVRHVLISFFAKGFVPIISTCVYAFVDVKWEVQSLFRASLPHLGTCCQFLFPKFPLVWSGLDDQVSPVLQGSSSRLMVSSALVAELVALWVALDAVTHEAVGIVFLRSLLVFLLELYFQSISISSLTFFRWTCKLLLLCYLVLSPLLIEFET